MVTFNQVTKRGYIRLLWRLHLLSCSREYQAPLDIENKDRLWSAHSIHITSSKMGKPKRKHPDIEEIIARPWCYYCERDFDDLKILINHQKAKHFKCERCGRRLNTAGGKSVIQTRELQLMFVGLSVHMTQVHKETLASIENALPNRAGLDVEIFGMEGIPEDIVTAHQQRVIGQFAQAEAERRAATGNAAPGATGAGAAKKPKFESPSDLKKRLAEHKAKKAAEQASAAAMLPPAEQDTDRRVQGKARIQMRS